MALPGKLSVGDKVVALGTFCGADGVTVCATPGAIGTVEGDGMDSPYPDKEDIVKVQFPDGAEAVYGNVETELAKVGSSLGSSKFTVGDTVMAIGESCEEKDQVVVCGADGVLLRAAAKEKGADKAEIVFRGRPGQPVAVIDLYAVAKRGAAICAGLSVGQEVVSGIHHETETGKIKPGDIGMALAVDGSCDDGKERISVKFPGCAPVAVQPGWQVMAVGGPKLPGGFSPGDAVVACVNAPPVNALEGGEVLGPPSNGQENMLRCRFPGMPTILVDGTWQVMAPNAEVLGGLRVGATVVAKVNRGKKIKKGEQGKVLGPAPDAPDKVRCLFDGTSAKFLPEELDGADAS